MQIKINSKVLAMFLHLQVNHFWSFEHIDRAKATAFSHSYHRYPAKFIPNIVEELLRKYTKENELVLDPFGGCGTTLVESKKMGRRSIGYDINPVAKFITEVKTTPIDPGLLEKEFAKLIKRIEKAPPKAVKRHLNNPRIAYWFSEKSIKELDSIYYETRKIKNSDIRKFFLCAFSHNLKNASRWLMKSIKPTIDKEKKITSIKSNFIKHAKSMVKKNLEFNNYLKGSGFLNVNSKVLIHNSTNNFPLEGNSIDLIVTSPPYVTSYEYADLHQLTLLWFDGNNKDFKDWKKISNNLNEFRKGFIGTSYKERQKGLFGSDTATSIIENLTNADKSLSNHVSNYFIDMYKSFEAMYKVLKPGRYASIVIGNTQLKGVDILNAEVAAEQMINIGFKKKEIIKRTVHNKMITPWRDVQTGKFTGKNNPNKKIAYEFEYILIMKKADV